MEAVTTCASAPGLASEVMTLFRARGLRKTGPGGGVAGERIRCTRSRCPRCPAWLAARAEAGTLVAIKVYAGLWFAAAEGASASTGTGR